MKKRNKKTRKAKGPTIVDGIDFAGNAIAYIPKYTYKLSELIVNASLSILIKLIQNKNNSSKSGSETKIIDSDNNKNYSKDKVEEKIIEKKQKKIKPKNTEAQYEEFKIIKEVNGDFDEFENFLFEKPSTIGIILGKRGSGKSAIGMRLLENIYAKTQRKCYGMGFDDSSLPWYIEAIEDIADIKNNSFVLIDEGGILFNSRNAMSKPNKILSDLILIARHKDLSIIFISQNSSNIDINIIRQADYLILKPASLLQNDFERKIIRKIYEENKKDFTKHKSVEGLTLIYSDIYRGFISNKLPGFWTTNLSKSFKHFGK